MSHSKCASQKICGELHDKGDSSDPPNTRKYYRHVLPGLIQTVLSNFLRRFFGGFSAGIVLYAGIRIITAFIKNPFRESIPKICDGILSIDCAKVATFFGLYPSTYHLLIELITSFRHNHDGWTYSVSGGLAGLSIALLNKSVRQTVVFFTLARALGAGVSTLVARDIVGAVPFFEVAMFSFCTSIILYCVSLRPNLINPGYYKSILKWSRDYTDGKLTTLFRTPGTKFVTCAESGLHQGNCMHHRLVDFIHSLPGFAKLYLPIHLTPVLVFKRNVLLERPIFVLKSLIKNLLLSTTFLGLMVTLAKLTICLLRNCIHRPPPIPAFIPVIAGATCGLALLLERYSRRKELCLFVISHTINILYIAIKKSKLKFILKVPHGFTILFALSMMSVMHAYEREPESLTLLINGLLKFFVGPRTNRQETKCSNK
ncbi:hypothetical protein Btru_052328 [Bulinus truncatus]|nr:hypothetical protein Btru_052328 [Bulinus truncatus]